jgi:hypothetical protein
VAQLAEQIVRKGHAFERRTGLELAMLVGRYISDLNHGRHAISMLTCRTHVNGSKQAEEGGPGLISDLENMRWLPA